jgi:thiol:disulfide interchange protein DsbC
MGIPVRDAAFVIGNKEAKNKIFVFDDLDCPYCARLHFELQSFLADHKDFGVYVMLFPLSIHPKSEEKSRAVYCLGGLKERESAVEGFFKAILENKKVDLPQEKKCDGSALDRVKQYGANTLKIKGTPVMVLPDGRVINGYMTKKELEDILSGNTAEKPVSSEKGGL